MAATGTCAKLEEADEITTAKVEEFILKVSRLLPKVELHCRLEGCVRPKTLWDVAQAKGIPMPRETEEEFYEFLGHSTTREPVELSQWLKSQSLTVPVVKLFFHVFKGDAANIKRVAMEMLEDKANEGVIYIEFRCTDFPDRAWPYHRRSGASCAGRVCDDAAAEK